MRAIQARELLAQGKIVLNGWSVIPGGFLAEVMASLGWDALTIDVQHGVIGHSEMVAMLQAISTTPLTPMVRLAANDPTLIGQALDAGARGYVLKNAMELDLVKAVKTVALGKAVLDPQVSKPASLKGERGSGLTTRELEILQHIVGGKSNKEIAVDLGLSSNTVAVHRANIMDALGIHKTAELVVYAIRNGLVSLP